jgi:2-methylcitrate dehydratase
MSITAKMADFTRSLQYEDIPETARHQARRFTLDSIGCAFAALNNEDMKAAHRYIQALGGTNQATVIGTGLRTNLSNAAFMNALLVRALDYNDIFWKQDPSHPSDILPAVWACAESERLSMREALVATVIAYELELRWCIAADPGIRERGWHHATLTQFVSPFVAARLLGLDENQTVSAAGISGSAHFTLGGVVAGHLTNMKNTADPMATRAGVDAALLAKEGYTGPDQVIEGKEGLIEVLDNVDWSIEKLLQNLGSEFMITECGYKAFPTEALTHQPITAVLNLRQQHDLVPDQIERVLIKTTTRGADILSDPSKYNPTTRETADHSLPWCIAVALVDGNVLPDSFSPEKLKDKNVWNMLEKIKVVADDEIDRLFPAVKRAIAEIITKNGKKIEETVDHAKGSPENPMTDEEVIAKFNSNASTVLDKNQRQQIIETTLEMGENDLTMDTFMRKLIC